jgi:xanthosine utilization system XapX-like protein
MPKISDPHGQLKDWLPFILVMALYVVLLGVTIFAIYFFIVITVPAPPASFVVTATLVFLIGLAILAFVSWIVEGRHRTSERILTSQ